MRPNNKALFIASMAFLLALFAYFKKNSYIENLVPGFEQKMKSNWVITGRGGPEDDVVMAYKNKVLFEFKPNGHLHCASGIFNDKIECKILEATTSMTTDGLCKCGQLIAERQANIGNWRHKHDRIGIEGKADLEMGKDQWLRLMAFDKGEYAGSPGRGGFAGWNLWSNTLKKGRCFCGGYGGPASMTPVVAHRHNEEHDHGGGWEDNKYGKNISKNLNLYK